MLKSLILITIFFIGIMGVANAQINNDNNKQSSSIMSKKLTPLQEYVTQHSGTEPAFHNEYWNNKEEGIYVDVATGEPLFSSIDKYDSGTGWPSFTKPIEYNNVDEKADSSLGMTRTEVKSSGGSHLGHVFEDGPKDKGGRRFCINSAALRFIPKKQLEAEGYGEFLDQFED